MLMPLPVHSGLPMHTISAPEKYLATSSSLPRKPPEHRQTALAAMSSVPSGVEQRTPATSPASFTSSSSAVVENRYSTPASSATLVKYAARSSPATP